MQVFFILFSIHFAVYQYINSKCLYRTHVKLTHSPSYSFQIFSELALLIKPRFLTTPSVQAGRGRKTEQSRHYPQRSSLRPHR